MYINMYITAILQIKFTYIDKKYMYQFYNLFPFKIYFPEIDLIV